MEPITNSNIRQLVKIYIEQPSNHPLPDINTWDVSRVTNMRYVFYNAKSFNQPLNNWNVSNVTDMDSMFSYASKFNQPLTNWIIHPNANVYKMFKNANSLNFDLNLPSTYRFTDDEFSDTSEEDYDEDATSDNIGIISQELYNNTTAVELTTSTKTVNLSQTNYDAVSMEDVKPLDYLSQDPANIIFLYNRNVYFSNKNDIKALVLDGSSVKYGCRTVATSIVPQRTNLFDEPCFNMNSIGIISGLVSISRMKTILETSELKVFEIPSEPIMHYVSTTSLQMLSSSPNAVGASHCQEGQEANVF